MSPRIIARFLAASAVYFGLAAAHVALARQKAANVDRPMPWLALHDMSERT